MTNLDDSIDLSGEAPATAKSGSYVLLCNSLYVWYVSFIIGFYEDFDNNTFGTSKKGIKRPLSNFTFQFQQKIISSDSISTGYLVEVTPETDESPTENDECNNDLKFVV